MKSITQNEVKESISDILDMVKNGEVIVIKSEHNQKKMAVIISYQKYKERRKRPLGILKGKAKYKIEDNFQITEEELLLS